MRATWQVRSRTTAAAGAVPRPRARHGLLPQRRDKLGDRRGAEPPLARAQCSTLRGLAYGRTRPASGWLAGVRWARPGRSGPPLAAIPRR